MEETKAVILDTYMYISTIAALSFVVHLSPKGWNL